MRKLSKIILTLLVILPTIVFGQVFNQNQIVVPPFLNGGIPYATSSAGNAKFGVISTSTLSSLLGLSATGATTTINGVIGPTFTFASSNAAFSYSTSTGEITLNLSTSTLATLLNLSQYATGTNYWIPNGTSIFNTNSGNVGIGTSSPQTKLDVYGNIRASTSTNDYLGLSFINNVPTLVANTIGGFPLTFVSGGGFGASFASNGFGGNTYSNFTLTGGRPKGIQSDNWLFFFTNNSSIPRLTIDAAGNVSVGTSTIAASTSSKMTIFGNTGVKAPIFTVASSTAASLFGIDYTGAALFNNSAGTLGQVLQSQGGNASPLWVATSSLGISGGTSGTSTPSVGIQGAIQFASSTSGYFDASSTAFVFATSTGFVGIGTSLPLAPLHVINTSGNEGIRVQRAGTPSQYIAIDENGGGAAHSIQAFGSKPFYFTNQDTTPAGTSFEFDVNGATSATGGTRALTLLNNGNLGIGTTTPPARLTTIGDSFISGAFRDSTFATGTIGQILQSTGTSTLWVATSTLGFGGSYVAGTGLTLTGNSFSVNTSQNIATLSNLTSNGLIKTSGGTGALSIATAGTDYEVPLTFSTGLNRTSNTITNTGVLSLGGLTGAVATSSLKIDLADTTGILPTTRGGTGTSTAPTLGQVLVGKADGTYAPVATSSLGISGTAINFADQETPTGTVNGSNTAFVLAHTPNPTASLQFFVNGQLMTSGGVDYTLSAATVTLVVAPPTGSIIRAWYRY